MSIPRMTDLLEELAGKIQLRLGSDDEATRKEATSEYLALATLHELRKIRMILEDEIGAEIADDDVVEDEDEV